jgi:ATP-binding cassette subfamily C protein CydC
MSIAAVLHVLIVPYICGRFASHEVHVGQILGVHRRSRFISLFSALVTLTIRGHWKDYAKRLGQLDARQRNTEIRIQNAVSAGRLLAYCVTISLIGSCLYLLSDFNSQTGRWVLHEGVQGTWVVGFILALLAVNELALPLVQSFVAQGKSQVGLRRLNQLYQEPSSASPLPSKNLEKPLTQISLQNWRGFHASSGMGNTALDLSVTLGETVWIRGASGSGKSTLLASIAGDCLSSGRALINGEESHLYGNCAYQKQISYLPQAPYIFQQSIAANLRLGNPNASHEELWSVLKAVSLADWAESLPQKLDTLLSSQGRNLSGGQRKRLALARLLLRKAPVLLLDEPFDGLDKATIETICDSLGHEYKPDILLLVSHVDSQIGEHARKIEL